MKFGIEDFYENLSRKSSLVKIGQKYGPLYMKTYLGFIVAGDTKSP
jgi:hypothetical protein